MVIELDKFRTVSRRMLVDAFVLVAPMGGRLLEAAETLNDEDLTKLFRARARYKLRGLHR